MTNKWVNNFAARVGAIHVPTDEPEVVLSEILNAYREFYGLWTSRTQATPINAEQAKMMLWDLRLGLREIDPLTHVENSPIENTTLFTAAVAWVNAVLDSNDPLQEGVVFVFVHTKPVWSANPINSLAFENLLKRMNWSYQGPARLCLVGNTGELPPFISNMVATVELAYPGPPEIRQMLAATMQLPISEIPHALVDAMRGLSNRQALQAARQAGTRRSKPEEAVQVITQAKIEMLETTAPFVKFLPIVEDPPPLVGVDGLLNYVLQLKSLVEHPELGVSPGGGIMLLGEPGTGKSSFVRYLSHLMQTPVVIFNFADIMGSLVGQSEGRLKQVIRAVNAIGPVIVQMDEIEKQMPSMKGQASDGGLGTRLVGMILPWMQDVFDLNQPIIFVATSNLAAIHNLPPELISRFQVFKVEVPDQASLAEIFTVHLGKITSHAFDTLALAHSLAASMKERQPVGRDVVQIIRSAQAHAVFERQVNVPTMDDIHYAINALRNEMVEIPVPGGSPIWAKPVRGKSSEKKSAATNLPRSLPGAGVIDFSNN